MEAVEGAFGMDCDYAMLQKLYGSPSEDEQRRYSPAGKRGPYKTKNVVAAQTTA